MRPEKKRRIYNPFRREAERNFFDFSSIVVSVDSHTKKSAILHQATLL